MSLFRSFTIQQREKAHMLMNRTWEPINGIYYANNKYRIELQTFDLWGQHKKFFKTCHIHERFDNEKSNWSSTPMFISQRVRNFIGVYYAPSMVYTDNPEKTKLIAGSYDVIIRVQ